MGDFIRDLRLGVRQLVRRPGFSFAAVASLALGIGLNTTLFGIVNAVLFKRSAIAEPERLVEVYSSWGETVPDLTTSYPDYLAIRDGVSALEGVAAHSFVRGILSTSGPPMLVTGEAVTANYFRVLGISPAVGRSFAEDENAPGSAAPVTVISHGLWQRRFGGRADAVGSNVKLSGLDYTIIGVAPRDFPGTVPGLPADFWVPVMMVDRLEFSGVQWSSDADEGPNTRRVDRRGSRWLFVKGRLAPGRTVEETRAQLAAIYNRLSTEFPKTNEKVRGNAVPSSGIRFHPLLDGYVKAAGAGLLGAVGLVLLVACANVANMLLARGASRRRELAIRAAVGATRRRIVVQLLSEGLVLASAGGAVGVVLAWWATRALSGFGTDVFPIRIDFDFGVDRTVLLFAVGVSTATALLFGLAPAWSASKPELVPALKDSMDGGARPGRFTLRDALVVGQLALSLVLLVSGALLTRGLLAARATDLGFDPAPISSLSFNLQMNGYDDARAEALVERAMGDLRALPGVTAVSTASRLPLAPDINMDGIKVEGHHGATDEPTTIDVVTVGADYFSVVGVPIIAGRAFTEADIAQHRRVVIVNETLAKMYWPGRSALGQRIFMGDFDQPQVEIVGVARDHKVRSVGEPPRPYMHRPGGPGRQVSLVVRTATPAAAALPTLRAAILAIEPQILFTEDAPAAEVAATTMAPTRIGALLVGAFGTLALLLAAVGLYGVVAYSVSLRTREVGVRIALGAERGQVLRMILGQGLRLAALGIVLGSLASAAAARVLESMLYGISGIDPVAYALASGTLLIAVVIANLAPALVASKIDPVRALRSE
jgi:predicted permease